MTTGFVREGIARKLIVFVVLFSSAITLLTTAIQLYLEYNNDVRGLEREFAQIENSYLRSVASTVWVADNQQLRVMLNGIQQLPDITRVEVMAQNGAVIAASGGPAPGETITRSFELTHLHREVVRPIGRLRVTATLSNILDRLFSRVFVILVSNGAKTFAVAIFIFFVFSYMVTRHLGTMADYTRRLTPGRLEQPLILNRTASVGVAGGARRPDELDDLAGAINEMRERLGTSYRALEENETRFRQLAENIREVIWIGSSDWRRVYYISPMFEEVWGRAVDEAYRDSRVWMNAVHPEDFVRVQREVRRLAETECADPAIPDFRIVQPGGGVRWIRARTFPVRGDDGALIRIAGIAEDVTRKREADESLRTKEQRYHSIIETTAEGYWLVDPSGLTLEVNDSLCRMLGYAREDIVGRPPIDFVASHAKEDFKNSFSRRAIAPYRVYETVYRARDGHDVYAKVSAGTLYGPSGELAETFAFVTDITQQRLAADEVRRMHAELERRVEERTRDLRIARNRAETADRAKSEFLANMSHELRTPLNAVIGFSDVMLQKVFGEMQNPRYEEYVRLINDSGLHLLDLISDLLDVSAIEAGRMDLHEEDVEIAQVVDSCLRLVRDRADKGRVAISVDAAQDTPMVLADSRRLKQILINLLTNAVKFTPEGGHVLVKTERTSDGGFAMRVIDTGIGMAEADLQAVLTPFTRTAAATEGHYEGTGLGLPLVKGLIEVLGGRFELESQVGKGTTASVYLPPSRVPTGVESIPA